uniref:Reticulon n=1 Tax=Cyprinus carpio TaxID=7962 RepID=A0A8C1J6Z5_CYPCA
MADPMNQSSQISSSQGLNDGHSASSKDSKFSVIDLVHWRDPKKSGVVFGVSLLLLLSLAAFSVISVVSYLLLALLCVTISFRIYKSVIQAVQKSNEGHPFKALMEKDVTVPPETFRKHVDVCLSHVNRVLKQMSRLFLVEDLVDSLKLAVVMWLLTYVGAVFNGITILILADILLFSVPPIYEKNKVRAISFSCKSCIGCSKKAFLVEVQISDYETTIITIIIIIITNIAVSCSFFTFWYPFDST